MYMTREVLYTCIGNVSSFNPLRGYRVCRLTEMSRKLFENFNYT